MLGKAIAFEMNQDGLNTFQGRFCLHKHVEVLKMLLNEAYKSRCSVYPRST